MHKLQFLIDSATHAAQSSAKRVRGSAVELVHAARAEPWLACLAVAVAVPCALLFSIEARSLFGAIYDVHEWRQGETYSIAYAFVHEGASFWYPKHAWRGDLSGIVGMEAPLYPYLVSLLMRVFGDSFVIARSVNFALFLLAFGLQIKRLSRQYGFSYGLGYVVLAAFCPAALCEFRQMQPDPAMLSLALLAAVCFHDHGRTGAPKSFAWGLGLYTLSLLTKPIAIAMLPAMFLFSVLGAERPRFRSVLARMGWFSIPLALMFAWDHWANLLVQRYMEGNLVISIDHNPAAMWAEMHNVQMRRFIFLGLVENYATHVTLFPAVLLGIPLSMQKEWRSWGVPFLAWLLGAALVSTAFSSRYYTNWYYMLPFVPPILFFGSVGVGALLEVVGLGKREPLKLGAALAIVLAAALIWPLLDDMPWDFVGNEAGKMAVHMRREVSNNPLYWIAIVASTLGAGGLVLLRDTFAWLPQPLLALVLGASVATTMVIPYKDLKQTVRFYTKEELWQTGHDDLREMRAAVDAYSTPRDLFVMNGSHPGLLVRARRVGFADDPGVVNALGPAHYAGKGARFFMSFEDLGPCPPSMQSLPLLAQGARWQLRCIDPKGCPKL